MLTLIDRETKSVRSVVINDLKSQTIGPIIMQSVAREAALMTDEAHRFQMIGRHFASHETVNHAHNDQLRNATPLITTNTVENYFSLFKRSMKGIYLAEFDFRYSNRSANGVEDTQRARIALSMIVGKRLTYWRTNRLVPALAEGERASQATKQTLATDRMIPSCQPILYNPPRKQIRNGGEL